MYIYTYIYKYICSDVMKKIQCAHLLITTMALWQAMEGQYIYIYIDIDICIYTLILTKIFLKLYQRRVTFQEEISQNLIRGLPKFESKRRFLKFHLTLSCETQMIASQCYC